MTISPSEITLLPLILRIQDVINPILLDKFKDDNSDYITNQYNTIIWTVLKNTLYSHEKYTKRSVVQVLSRSRSIQLYDEWNQKLVVDILNKIKSAIKPLKLLDPSFTTIHPTILMNIYNSNIKYNVLMDLIFIDHMDELKYYFSHNKDKLNRTRDKEIDDDFIKHFINYLKFLYSIHDTSTIKVIIKYLCYLNEVDKSIRLKNDPSYFIDPESYYSIFHNAVNSKSDSLSNMEWISIKKTMVRELIDEIDLMDNVA